MNILLLGGTTEASEMALTLARAGIDATFSYAGRTKAPVAQPLPQRTGGFGGVAGLESYLHDHAITHVIDATHPFAAGMSRNAHAACVSTGTPLMRLERPAWQPGPGDDWRFVPTVEDLPGALPDAPCRAFLAIGKQQIGLFAGRPQHHYMLRLVDPPDAPLPLPDTTIVIARGPFTAQGDTALMQEHRITHVLCKNAGGSGARAKLDAARALGLPVIMAHRPLLPGDTVAHDVEKVMNWLGHDAERGV
ncbi:cobalt-precorrin-6A reductase [Sulfitobacter alexandrii]|uniref:Cobalt-precorrin-6A reductase n=1 Tax=Sulfitobacter alexandrii TaxID=1917485 RepID=A0A1J0WKY3_9RHOB|nr:cobalt-precorrin-6A reductase [Sulfitobacter alexandrii]APE44949.1 cobalt-precorrin-6A reductase [Sulfitobacter alexandrii]